MNTLVLIASVGFFSMNLVQAQTPTPSPYDQTSAMTNQVPTGIHQNTPGVNIPNDAQIVQDVISANNADIDAGKLAQKKTSDPGVKAFAKEMILDHGRANQKMDKIIQTQAIKKEASLTSRGMDSASKDTARKLKDLSGVDFDRAYINGEVMMHQIVLASIDQDLLPHVQSSELRTYLTNLRPTIADHLEKAKKLAEQFKL